MLEAMVYVQAYGLENREDDSRDKRQT